MADWRQIQARIRKAKASTAPADQLAELYQRTRDAMVAFELARWQEKAGENVEAAKWYTAAAERFRRAQWRVKAEEALTRLGAPIPASMSTEQIASADSAAGVIAAADDSAAADADDSVGNSIAAKSVSTHSASPRKTTPSAPAAVPFDVENEIEHPDEETESDADEQDAVRDVLAETAEAVAVAPGAGAAGAPAKKHRRRGRRGGRNRRRDGQPGQPGGRVTAGATDSVAAGTAGRREPGRHVSGAAESRGASSLSSSLGSPAASSAASHRPAIVPSSVVPPEPVAEAPTRSFERTTASEPEVSRHSVGATTSSAFVGRMRTGEPALASRISQLESQLRRLLACPMASLEDADSAPAGPGVLVLSDSDQVTHYYVEECQTLRIGIGNLMRGARGSKGLSQLKQRMAENLGVPEARVSKYLKDNCGVRWLQLDEGAAQLAHFAIAVLRPVVNE